MKNLSFCLFFFALLISCSKEEPITPDPIIDTITPDTVVIIIDNTTELLPTISLVSGEEGEFEGVFGGVTNGSLQYDIEATASDGFVSLQILKILDGVEIDYETIDDTHPSYTVGSNTISYHLNYILSAADVDKDLSFKAVVKDKNNNTATLKFAKAKVRLPMLIKTITLETRLPPNGDITVPYYLMISGDDISAVDHSTAVNVDQDQDIAMVFSVNDGSGFYLVSPNTVLETILVNGIQHRSVTRFKEVQGSLNETPLIGYYNSFDVYETERVFGILDFNSHEEKAEQVSIVNKVFFFQTEDNRTGLIKVRDFQTEDSYAYLTIDIMVSQ